MVIRRSLADRPVAGLAVPRLPMRSQGPGRQVYVVLAFTRGARNAGVGEALEGESCRQGWVIAQARRRSSRRRHPRAVISKLPVRSRTRSSRLVRSRRITFLTRRADAEASTSCRTAATTSGRRQGIRHVVRMTSSRRQISSAEQRRTLPADRSVASAAIRRLVLCTSTATPRSRR